MITAIRNGLWNALAHVVGALTAAVGSILIVRSLTPEAYGAFSYYVWIAGILSTLGTLAAPLALTKITSELRGQQAHTEARTLAHAVFLALLSTNLLLGLGVVLWALLSPTPQRSYLLIVAAFLLPNALAAVFRSTLWGGERYRGVSLPEMLTALLQLALIVFAFLARWDAPGFVAAVLLASVARAIGLAWALRRPSGAPLAIPPMPSRATLRRYLAFFAPATLSLLFTIIIWERSEVFFLKWLSTLEQVGFYSLAYTAYAMFLALGWALVNGFHPAISRDYGAGEWLQIRAKVRQGVILAAIYAVPLSFGGWVTLEALFRLLYGAKMLPAVLAAHVLFAGLLPGVVASVFGFTMNAVGHAWLSVRLGIVLSMVNIGLDLLLIPRLGALGGAIANTSSQLIYSIILVIVARRLYRIAPPWRILDRIVGLGAITTFILPYIVQSRLPGAWGLVSAIAVAGCLYAIGIWRLGYLRLLRTSEAAIEKPAPGDWYIKPSIHARS